MRQDSGDRYQFIDKLYVGGGGGGLNPSPVDGRGDGMDGNLCILWKKF